MARQNRSEIFDPLQVSVNHCINRAVRRAMLCGVDRYSGQSYEHRREWVRERLVFLASQYGVDVVGYAIMGNHLHVILRNRPDVVAEWSDEEVARRIWNLFPKRKNDDGTPAEPTEFDLNILQASRQLIDEYRRRLSDISWLMRQLAEKIARLANEEDGCTGRFWEGRFKCQPLLDEAAILACAAYVDLNPVRAKIAETPEQSDYTSVQDRIKSLREQQAKDEKLLPGICRSDDFLSPVYQSERAAPGPKVSKSPHRASDKGFTWIKLENYLSLVDWTGRQIRRGKRGRIPASCQPILKRLGLDRSIWCDLVENFGRLFKRVAGREDQLTDGDVRHRASGGPALLTPG